MYITDQRLAFLNAFNVIKGNLKLQKVIVIRLP